MLKHFFQGAKRHSRARFFIALPLQDRRHWGGLKDTVVGLFDPADEYSFAALFVAT